MKHLKTYKIFELHSDTYLNAALKSQKPKQKQNLYNKAYKNKTPRDLLDYIDTLYNIDVSTSCIDVGSMDHIILYDIVGGANDFTNIRISNENNNHFIHIGLSDIYDECYTIIKDGVIIEERTSNLYQHRDLIHTLTDNDIIVDYIEKVDLSEFRNGIICDPDGDTNFFRISIEDGNTREYIYDDENDYICDFIRFGSSYLSEVLKHIIEFISSGGFDKI